ncbi:protein argonaute MEL1-like [Cornus florida]|uniref:protein argonaute MEL1-like n=1 Tax=Cornus florida TaxID=4283 RepID=UPI00289962B8|nr:protein argonaute MEL1-like [Cornus florida]
MVSVVEYFKNIYRIPLHYLFLPAIQVGNDTKPVYLPMKLCKIIEGQRHDLKRLNEKEVAALLKANCQPPNVNEGDSNRMVARNNYNNKMIVNEFGLQVSAELTSIDARVFPPPTLQYHGTGHEALVNPKMGQWCLFKKKMFKGGKVESWTCINFSQIKTEGASVFLLEAFASDPNDIEEELTEIYSRSSSPTSVVNYYFARWTIKRICETKLGIVSQCCQPRKVLQGLMQHLKSVVLKINVKVVASIDWPEVTYRAVVSAQPPRKEIIQNLYTVTKAPIKGLVHGGMIRELLMEFNRSTNHKPKRIIFYRDGIGEGQFAQVLLFEMDAIRKACESFEENYRPLVTFVVVQKRHHTSLFPADGTIHNILPGTVVDNMICHPTQFYLCSHAATKGVSRPKHYHDENNFTADGLQTLANNLCYTSARYTRSVSIVPPVYYAHLAANRGRCYMEDDMSDTASTSGGRGSRERDVEVRPLPGIKENVQAVMFYC